jgi:hypothetical protein
MQHSSSSHGHAVAADRVLPMQALRSRHASASIEASRRARIRSPPAEPRVLVLWLNQVTSWFCGEPPQTPVQTPVVSRYPASAPIDDFVLLFLPPCWPPGPSSQAYLSLHSSEAPQGIDLSRPLFTWTNANQAATCTYNTRPTVSPHHVVNHSSQPGVTNHRSLDVPVLSGYPPPPSPHLPSSSVAFFGVHMRHVSNTCLI